MSDKTKFIIQLLGGISLIIGALWYLANQFASIDTQLNKVVLVDIPEIKNTLGKNSERSDKISADMYDLTKKTTDLGDQAESVSKIETNLELLTQKINDELLSEINQFEKERKRNIKEVRTLSQKIDSLSSQYVKFLKLSKDKIIVSIPPKWVDELPRRDGKVFAVGISPSTKKLRRAQQMAVEQASSNLAEMLERKTVNAIVHTIQSSGNLPPKNFEELSNEFKAQITEAVNEFIVDTCVESYWIDPTGYVYALVSLPVENRIGGSKLGMLIEALKLTHQSITEALKQDFEKQLKVELLK